MAALDALHHLGLFPAQDARDMAAALAGTAPPVPVFAVRSVLARTPRRAALGTVPSSRPGSGRLRATSASRVHGKAAGYGYRPYTGPVPEGR
ncbi:hypothetical protein CF54_19775 [Streptomyces sp. Tu 6176]|nr:hypothetical protein CF54_19775 [Streptomyces sp. Tu 6176]